MIETETNTQIEDPEAAHADYEKQVNDIESELLKLISSDGDIPEKKHAALLELDDFNKVYLEKKFQGNSFDRINFHIQSKLIGEMLKELEGESLITARIHNPRKIAEGGMETEFVIASFADNEKNTPLAVKIIREEAGNEIRETFIQEQKVLKTLLEKYKDNYPPNLLKLYAVGDGVTATERIAGGISLREIIKTNPDSITLDDVISWSRSICYGLETLYAAGFEAHNDLSPDNCIMDENGVVYLIDFSLVDENKTKLDGNTFRSGGKTKYMSPEKCVKYSDGNIQPEIDRKSDVYALAIMTYQFLTKNSDPYGRNLKELKGVEMMIAAYGNEILNRGFFIHDEKGNFVAEEKLSILAGKYQYIEISKENCSLTSDQNIIDNLNTIIKKALAFDPENRQQSPAFFFQELLQALHPVS